MKPNKTKISLAVLAVLSSGQFAQAEEPQSDAETQVVVITGVASSVESSLHQKRKASNFIESITAEDIGKFPDLNLSESLQRVSGVTLERNNVGDGSAINLRGLGPQFTAVTINGMEGVSSGTDNNFGNSNGSRGFNFEILPSELFTNATINKSVDAAQIEGGMAGVVELQTPRPLDQKGFRYVATVKENYSSKSGEFDPRGTISVSKNWNRVFGLSAALAVANTRYRSDSAQGGSYRPFAAVNTGSRADDITRAADVANGPRYIYFDDQRKTLGATATAQWKPSRDFEVSADLLFGKLSSDRNITRDDAATESGVNNPVGVTIESGLITAGRFTGVQQRVGTNYLTTEEELGQASVQATWRPNDEWTVKPFVGRARRSADRTWDLYSFRLARNGAFDPGIVEYRIRGDHLDFSSTATDFSSNPGDFLFNVFVARPSKDTDTSTSAKLDAEREFHPGSPITSLRFGIRATEHVKDTRLSQWRLNRAPNVSISTPPSLGSVFANVDFDVAGSGSSVPGSLLVVDPGKIQDTFFPGGQPVAGTVRAELTAYGAQQSYTIKEQTRNAYLAAAFSIGAVSFDVGGRYVHTTQTSSGFAVENANLATQRITPVSYSSSYSMFLPSANLRHELASGVILRSAFSHTLTRPDLSQLAPSETVAGIDQSGGKGTRGNPMLKPYKSTNLDAGIEWYIDKAAMVGAAVFRKDVGGFIDTATFTETRSFPRQADGVIVSGPILFTQPVNGVSAKINGVELSAQSRFTFLPQGWWRNLGALINYTYTDSSANFAVVGDVRSSGLPGLSKNSYNASVYYDDGVFEGRLSYAWRGKYLAAFSDDFGVPRFRNPYGQVDLSASYKITKRLSVQLDVLNLTQQQFVDKSSAKLYPYGVVDLDRRILVGARYSL